MSSCPSHVPNPRIDKATEQVFEATLKPLGNLGKQHLESIHPSSQPSASSLQKVVFALRINDF